MNQRSSQFDTLISWLKTSSSESSFRSSRRKGVLYVVVVLSIWFLNDIGVHSFLQQPSVPSKNYYHDYHQSYNTFHIRRSLSFLLKATRSKKQDTTNAASSVIYQKVVRPPPGIPDILFLGYLVEYIQDHFQLPERLPMVYERNVPMDDNSNNIILEWDSPLSPNPSLTRREVQIVAIMTDDEDDKNSIPKMAMVVVQKSKMDMKNSKDTKTSSSTTTKTLPPMMVNLFTDSERQILKAFDRGLEDFMAGQINGLGRDNNKPQPVKRTFQQGKDEILAELMEDDDDNDNEVNRNTNKQNMKSTRNDSTIMDAEVVSEKQQQIKDNGIDKETKLRQRENVLKSMNAPVDKSNTNNKEDMVTGLDFAVQAAKKARLKRQQQGLNDFAVQAARKKAASKRQYTSTNKKTESTHKIDYNQNRQKTQVTRQSSVNTNTKSESQKINLSAIRPPVLDPNKSGVRRKFMTTISTPEDYFKSSQQNNSPTSNNNTVVSTKDHLHVKVRKESSTSKNNIVSSTNDDRPVKVMKETTDSVKSTILLDSEKKKRKINMIVKDMDKDSNSTSNEITDKKIKESNFTDSVKSMNLQNLNEKKRKINVSIQDEDNDPTSASNDITDEKTKEMIDAAQDALKEMEEKGDDLSPEELLEKVMKFGEEKEREEAVGSGFVSGAFDKAKELLKEQRNIREERIRKQVIEKVAMESLHNNDATTTTPGVKEITPDEEIRKMFEAGERFADGRITKFSKQGVDASSITEKGTTEKDVESLIASDKTISKYARILDDELAQLEVQINKSPGEELDSPDKNPLFDILSGPEVYNPNVDTETAVNWPGALPGTKKIRLPRELDEAVKQARFAADALFNMKEIETDNGEVVFKVGERELSKRQVSNLQSVFTEAVEIGLIDNPVQVQAEASRLQMLLDELFYQPEERLREIASNYKDLLLSDNFVQLVKHRLNKMADRDIDALRRDDDSLEQAHARERELLGQLVVYTQLLLKETQALGAELESQQLEIIRSICKVAMDPRHRTEEETAMALTDAVRDMRPLFDDAFVAYLKYAIAEEEGRLARAGVLDDPEHNQWLFVLKIVQQGVYTELARGINRLLEHIWYILRMETAIERRQLLEKLVDVMPTLDVRPFVRVVDNIVGALGESVRGDFDGVMPLGEMTNKLLQLHRDMKEVLPPERINEMSRDADEWAARQKQRLLEQRKQTKQRLKAAQETEHLDSEIEAIGRRGEIDRFD